MAQLFHLCSRNMPEGGFDALRRALTRKLSERGCTLGETGFAVEINIAPGLPEGAYRMEAANGGVCVTASDGCAAFAGVGDFLTMSAFDGGGGFTVAPCLPMSFLPSRPVRGLYFASHFHNSYHVAPLEMVFEQIEDIALRGSNALALSYDMHHYRDIDAPDSIAMIVRLRALLGYARRIGMKTCLTMLSNEAFQGTRRRCAPLPRRGEPITAARMGITQPLPQEVMPAAKLIVSTWYFDKFISGEWDAFFEAAQSGVIDGAAYLMGYFLEGKLPGVIAQKGMPRGKSMLSFPEISIVGAVPWGGFGANPLPAHLQRTNDSGMRLYSGQFCYSEGIFEDAYKAIMLGACSGRYEKALDALRDYARFEFSVQDPAEIVEMMC